MKAIFLASGKSSRMAPLREKNLLSFCGKPLFVHLINNAMKGGVTSFVVVTNGENTAEITAIIAQEKIPAEVVVQEDLSTGMAGGVLVGLAQVEKDAPALVLGGNDYILPEAYTRVISALKQHDGALLAKRVETYFPGGYLTISGDKIAGIQEKPGAGNEPSELVNIVCHGFARAGDLLTKLSAAALGEDDAYEQALDALFAEKTFAPVVYTGVWQAVKYPWHVLDMQKLIIKNTKKQGKKSAEIADSATVEAGVIVAPGAKIMPNAVVCGDTYIGENAVVGNNTLVRDSHISAGAVVGYNTEIARSYLGPNTTTHMAYIGDSVVGREVNFGAYSCTANLRLDKTPVSVFIKNQKISTNREKFGAIVGDFAQIGIHACLMPGAKVLEKSFVFPNSVFPEKK